MRPEAADPRTSEGDVRDGYTEKSGRCTTGSNFQTYLYAPLKNSIGIS